MGHKVKPKVMKLGNGWAGGKWEREGIDKDWRQIREKGKAE